MLDVVDMLRLGLIVWEIRRIIIAVVDRVQTLAPLKVLLAPDVVTREVNPVDPTRTALGVAIPVVVPTLGHRGVVILVADPTRETVLLLLVMVVVVVRADTVVATLLITTIVVMPLIITIVVMRQTTRTVDTLQTTRTAVRNHAKKNRLFCQQIPTVDILPEVLHPPFPLPIPTVGILPEVLHPLFLLLTLTVGLPRQLRSHASLVLTHKLCCHPAPTVDLLLPQLQ